MNIKDFSKYQLVNGNNDNPVLVSNPRYYNFSIQSKGAIDPTLVSPMFDSEDQLQVNADLIDLIYNIATFAEQADSGCGYWWYITDIKSQYINKIGAAGYFMVLSATVIAVEDNNIPAASPSNV
jgi:hypothetical protein